MSLADSTSARSPLTHNVEVIVQGFSAPQQLLDCRGQRRASWVSFLGIATTDAGGAAARGFGADRVAYGRE